MIIIYNILTKLDDDDYYGCEMILLVFSIHHGSITALKSCSKLTLNGDGFLFALPSLKLTANAPAHGCLEYVCFLLGWPIFRCELLVFRKCNCCNKVFSTCNISRLC